MKKYVLFLFCLMLSFLAKAQYSIPSPDMSAWVRLDADKKHGIRSKIMRPYVMRMSVTVKGKKMIRNREIGLEILSHGRRSSFGKSDDDDDDEYKILNVTDVFPDEHPNGILGTFIGNQVFPWRTMLFDEEEEQEKKTALDEWENLYPHNKVLSWKDALRSASIGLTTSWISGKRWGNVSTCQGISADFAYKHLYGGLSCTPCYEILYVFWEYDYDPFIGVVGSVRSWDMSCRFGYNLPIQNGYDIWTFAPYATATYLNLHQHGKIHPTYKDVEDHHHYLVGLGLKAQYQMRQRITFGVSYEYQAFTGRKEPHGRNSFIVTMGYGF